MTASIVLRWFFRVPHARRVVGTESRELLIDRRLARFGLSPTEASEGKTPKCFGIDMVLTPTRRMKYSKQRVLRPPRVRSESRSSTTAYRPMRAQRLTKGDDISASVILNQAKSGRDSCDLCSAESLGYSKLTVVAFVASGVPAITTVIFSSTSLPQKRTGLVSCALVA